MHNGPVLRKLTELVNILDALTDEQFLYHTKRSGNDFAAWLEDTLLHPRCAVRVVRTRSRAGMKKVLLSCKD